MKQRKLTFCLNVFCLQVVTLPDGKKLQPAQGNNMLIFPGLGKGAVLVSDCCVVNMKGNNDAKKLLYCARGSFLQCGAKAVTDAMIAASVRCESRIVIIIILFSDGFLFFVSVVEMR